MYNTDHVTRVDLDNDLTKEMCIRDRFTTVLFKGETLHWNHFASFVCLVLAVYFVFYK